MSTSGHPDPNPGASDLSGRDFGDFRLLRRLGRGAMAEVYLAEQASLNRRVAIKILKPELAGDRVYLQRFQREAQAAAALVHANIVQVYEVGQRDALHYIAQEYVEGQNLREWIGRHGPADVPHALSIVRQAAAALAKAAEHGVVHRDIKPENIMLTRAGEVKVADFGLARFSRTGDSLDLTEVGMTLGTPLYMSPEQVEGKPLDPRSDIYSLGVTTYHLLAGAPPFAGESALAVAVQHLNKLPVPIEELRPDLPSSLCRVVAGMMAKNPDDRYASASDLLVDLRRAQAEQTPEAWPDDVPRLEEGAARPLPAAQATVQLQSLMKNQEPRTRGRGWRRLALSLALLAAAVAGAAWGNRSAGPFLLDRRPGETTLAPKQPSALRQWYYASRMGTPSAWQSVLVHYPKNEYLGKRAKQQLARIHLRDGNHREAMALFAELASLGEGDEEFRAFGLAGKYGLLVLEKRPDEAARVLDELHPIRDRLDDAFVRQFLESALAKSRSATGQQWQQWLKEQFGEE